MYFPRVVITNLIKVLSFLLIASTVTYADTNPFDESSDRSMEYLIGDIISVEEGLQAEVLANTEDSIEIGLFNQENQVTATLMWDIKAGSGSARLNINREDEKTLPMSVSEQMSSENRMETLAEGLFLMAAQTSESHLPEESDFKSSVSKINNKASRAVTTSGWMVPYTSHIPPYDTTWNVARYKGQPNSHPNYYGGRYSKINRRIEGRARYNLPNGDTNHVWVRLLAQTVDLLSSDISTAKWEVMGWVLADGSNNRFTFMIPEDYDLDSGDTLTAINSVHNNLVWTSRVFAADAWSESKKRTSFTWMQLSVAER